MTDSAKQLSDLALMLSKASNALGTVESIAEVLDGYDEGELEAEDALEQIMDLVASYEALESLARMSPEEMEQFLAEQDDEDDGDDSPPPPERIKS